MFHVGAKGVSDRSELTPCKPISLFLCLCCDYNAMQELKAPAGLAMARE